MPGQVPYYSGAVEVSSLTGVSPELSDGLNADGSRTGGRAYLGNTCTEGIYSNKDYVAWNLFNKTLSYTVDLRFAPGGEWDLHV
jgi:hypothetical protein